MASILISCVAPCCLGNGSSSLQHCASSNRLQLSASSSLSSKFFVSRLTRVVQVEEQKVNKHSGKAYAATTVREDIEEYTISTWAEFEIGQSTVYWETENGLPPASGEPLTIFYNPVASKLVPHAEYGIAFNGGFNQPIMCGGEPRVMTRKDRGKISAPFYAIKIVVPKHALTLIFSFTNGMNWDGPYKLQFEIPTKWRNRSLSFFNEVSIKEPMFCSFYLEFWNFEGILDSSLIK